MGQVQHHNRMRDEPIRFVGFRLNKARSRDCASGLRNWGMPSFALWHKHTSDYTSFSCIITHHDSDTLGLRNWGMPSFALWHKHISDHASLSGLRNWGMPSFALWHKHTSDHASLSGLRNWGMPSFALWHKHTSDYASFSCITTQRHVKCRAENRSTGRPLSRQCRIHWQFPDGSRHSSVALSTLSVTRIMAVLVLLSVVGVGMQQCTIQNHIFNI